MSAVVTCPKCGKEKPNSAKIAGKVVTCRKCDVSFTAPEMARAAKVVSSVPPPHLTDVDEAYKSIMRKRNLSPEKPMIPPNAATAIYVLTASSVVLLFVPCIWFFGVPLVVGTAVYTLISINRYRITAGIAFCFFVLVIASIGGVKMAIHAAMVIQNASDAMSDSEFRRLQQRGFRD